VWAIKTRRLVFLFSLAFICIALFFAHQLQLRDYVINGYTYKSKVRFASEELNEIQGLKKRLEAFQKITVDSISYSNYSLNVDRIQSQRIDEGAEDLSECAK
jgi:hypothetical protein